jgi:hypothetical protein
MPDPSDALHWLAEVLVRVHRTPHCAAARFFIVLRA